MEPFTFEWKMPLSQYKECKVKERLWSTSYVTPQYLPLKFYLRLFPHGDDEENSEFISYFLFCEPPNNQTITLIYNLYIQDESGRRIAESPWEGEFGVKHQTWGKRRFCRRPIISAGSDDNRFITFGCKVEVKDFNREMFEPKKIYPSVPLEESFSENYDETESDISREVVRTQLADDIVLIQEKKSESEESQPPADSEVEPEESQNSSIFDDEGNDGDVEEKESGKDKKVLSKLGGKIAQLYQNMEISDVCLSVDGEDIKAHKLILYLHSPCLAAMIKQDDWISPSTKIDIEGYAPATVQKALEFMYTETIANVRDLEVDQMMELSRFATMFAINDLKAFINDQIIESVDISTACTLANLSSIYNEEEIHSTALDFITKNLAAVKLDESFVELSGENAKAILRML